MLRNKDSRIERLAGAAVLSGLSKRQLREVASLTTEVRLPAGHVLCHQGDVALEAFLLVDGTVSVTQDGTPLGVVVDGGSFLGETAVLDRHPRLATLTAMTEVTVLAMSSREFAQLVLRFPSVSEAIRSVVYTLTEEHVFVPAVGQAAPRRRVGAAAG